MTNPGPTVSIVIPAFNEQSTIRSCLLAAINQTVSAAEIIVIDNRSTDDTADVVRSVQDLYPEAPILCLSQFAEQGLVPTRNFGFDRAQGSIIGRIDADSIIEPNWVEEVQEAFADETIAAATGPVQYYDMPLLRWGLRADDVMRQFLLKLTREYHFLFGSNMAIRRDAWRIIRSEVCRDEDDAFHEDLDLSIHLARTAQVVAYVPTMVSGMSARRLEDSPRDYASYALRFERTYARHGIRNPALRIPMWIFLAIYPAAKMMRVIQQRREFKAALGV